MTTSQHLLRWFLIFSVFFLSVAQAWSQTRISKSGNISTDETWSADTIDVTGDVIINDNVTLTIDPGVLVAFQGYFSLEVKGRLLAIGGPGAGDTIRFERMDSTGWHDFSSTAGGWKGIVINNYGSMDDNDSTVLSYCKVRFGKSINTGDFNFWGGGLYCRSFDKLVIKNSLFANNYAEYGGSAIYFQASAGRLTDNAFLYNHAHKGSSGNGGAFAMSGGSVEITGNLFANNYAYQQGGAISLFSGYAMIRNNEFRDNSCWYGGGAISVSTNAVADIIENEIYRNEVERRGGAMYIVGVNTRIANNLIYENQTNPSDGYLYCSGGAIYFNEGSVARLDTNHIYSNVNNGTIGGAILSWADSNFFIGNEIYDNSTVQSAGGIYIHPDAVYSILRDNKVHGNTGTNVAYSVGGGMHISSETLILDGNEIYNNSGVYRGGGIRISGCAPIMKNNIVANNSADDMGGGIYLYSSEGEFQNNIIVNNEAPSGGGVGLETSSPAFVNNTICLNKASSADKGGAVAVGNQSIPRFHNDIFYGNEDDAGPHQIYFSQPNPVAYFSYCNIEGGVDNFTLASGSLQGDKVGLIDADPAFVSASSPAGNAGDGMGANWRITSTSVCINQGTNDILGSELPETDYYANQRTSYSLPDIGSHEFSQSSFEISSNISQDVTWTADTVKITAKVHVLPNITLTISPGVYVKFMGDFELEISGALRAIGTETDSIIFSIHDTNDFSNLAVSDGGWSGIYFSIPQSSEISEIAYARIEYVKERTFSNGAVYVAYGSGMNIRNSTFQNNIARRGGAAINVSGTAINITDCHFSNNITYETTPPTGSASAIYLSSSNSTIERCVFENNNASGKGTIYMTQSHPVIRDNIFRNNHVAEEGGALFIFAYSNPDITENSIINNTADGKGGGIYAYNKCSPTISLNHIANNQAQIGGGIYAYDIKNSTRITGNIIANNSASLDGGAIYLDNCSPEISNNTLTNNIAGSSGGGLYSVLSVPVIYNTLVWGNEDGGGLNSLHILEGDGAMIWFSDIQGGSTDITGGSSLSYEDNLDSDPVFTNPSGGTGTGFNSIAEGWQLLSTSSLINAGNKDIAELELADFDILGNTRINAEQVDIGALENMAGLPEITLQPGSKIRCSGETAMFKVACSDSVNYQWMKNGVDIVGQVFATLEFDSVKITNEGSYQCKLSNAYGTTLSTPVLLQVKERPMILQGPPDTWARINSPVTLELYSRGSDLNFQWQKDNIYIPGAVIPKLTILNPGLDDEGSYSCIISSTCGSDTTDEASLYMAPQLCMITVDSATGHNLVIWEKVSSAPIDFYNVYRESSAAGLYDLVESVASSDLSLVEDTVANPTVQAYIYKITAVDTGGIESDIDLCRAHKTIHLLASINPELQTTQLEWDKYYGFEYSSYNIYRSGDGLDFSIIYAISASNYSWTDPSPLEGITFYRLAVVKPGSCSPTGNLKAGTGPYYHSLSNMDDNKLRADNDSQDPTDMTLSKNTIDENQSVGTLVGRLVTEDPDTSDSHTYKLVSGVGDTDNYSFTTLGDMLITAEILDYEAEDTLYVRIKSTDVTDLFIEKEYMILVNDVNEEADNLAPSDIGLSFSSIDENQPVGTLVGRLSTVDPDTSDYHTYRLVSGAGDTDNMRFTTMGNMLISAEIFDFETRDTLYVRINSSDIGNLDIEKEFMILVKDTTEASVNLAPTDIALSNSSIDENQSVGTLVGRLSTVDPDISDYHTYSLASGTGDTDNMRFSILGDMLISAETFDYESMDTAYVRIKSTDKADQFIEKEYMILVNDVNEEAGNLAPTDISLSSDSIAENQSVGTLVGRLTTLDPDVPDLHTYSLVSGAGDSDNNRLTILVDMLITAEIFDYEIRDTLYVRIRSTDQGDLSIQKAFKIIVSDVSEGSANLAPTDINLSFSSIDENQSVGTLIGRLLTDDPDLDDDHKYRLVDGSGGDDNAYFSLISDLLISADVFDYEAKNSYTVRIRSSDDGDGKLSFEKVFTIDVLDLLETALADQETGPLLIYPNPFAEIATIRFPNPGNQEYLFILTDIRGKTVRLMDNITECEIIIYRKELASGLYFIELRGEKTYKARLMVE